MNVDLLYRNRFAKRAFLGAILAATCASASAASFDCNKARSKSERLVCGDAKLSAMDDRLAALAAAGKKRAASPRAYQRALDAAWVVRQRCEDIACVESWYVRRIEELSNAETDSAAVRSPANTTRAEVLVKAPNVDNLTEGPVKPNVIPGAQLQVIGGELGFYIPLTREEFMERYSASGGQCGVSRQLPSLKALSRSAESDCWTGTECRAPAAGLRCEILRTGYDSTGRIVLFTTTLSTDDEKRAEGVRNMGKVVDRFAEFGGSEIRTREVRIGRVLYTTGYQGQFMLEAEVMAGEGGVQVGTFSVATK